MSTATAGELVRAAGRELGRAGIEAPLREARLLLAHASALDHAALIGWPERPVPRTAAELFRRLVDRRGRREPLARILGRREFWSLSFRLGPETLDPRPDTETVVAAALAHIADREATIRVVDFGTGTGCILLALLSELPHARGLGIERSPGAAAVAASNARALGLAGRASFAVADWASALASQSHDVAVANPPYIPSGDIGRLESEVRDHDPVAALDGGADGLDAYRTLGPALARILVPGGLAVLEVGAGQAEAVRGLLAGAGLELPEVLPDLAGIPRAVVVRRGGLRK